MQNSCLNNRLFYKISFLGQVVASVILLYGKDCKKQPKPGSCRFSWHTGASWHPRDCTGWCATDTLGKGSETSCVILPQDMSVPDQIRVPGGMLICSQNRIVSLWYPAFQRHVYSRIPHAPLTMNPCAVWPDSKIMSFIMHCYGEYLRSQKYLAIFS